MPEGFPPGGLVGGSVRTGAGQALPGGFPRRLRRGSPTFFEESRRKEHQGLRPWTPVFDSRSLPLAGFWDRYSWYDSGAVSSDMLRPIWNAFFREEICEKAFCERRFPNQGTDVGPEIAPQPPRCASTPKAFPSGEGAPVRTLGRMRGRFGTQPFLVESLSGSRQSPQRNFSPAPLGKSIAPSSVTFGDSFPPRGSLWAVKPYTKKRSKSGHIHGHRTSPTTGTMCHNRQNERVATSGP